MSNFFYTKLSICLLAIVGNTCTTHQKSSSITMSNNTPTVIVDTVLLIKNETDKSLFPLVKDSVSEITINLVGDLMCHLPQTNNAKLANGQYDFNPSFEYIKPYLQNADITIGNLETTFAGTKLPYAGYPAFNSPDAYCQALKNTGFDFLVTANNHSMDTKEEGLLRTIDVINNNKLGYAGTYKNQADRDSIRILNIKGIKLCILNYTYGTNGSYPSNEHAYMLNLIDSTLITNDIKKAKTKGSDVVLVFYHMGLENVVEPTTAQKNAVKFALQAGANLVIGAHPHMISPTKTMYSDVIKDTTFIAYSLGNFLSNQYWRYTDAGVILKLTIQKNYTQNKTAYKRASYTPTWVYRGDGSKKIHIVLPCQWVADSTKLPDFINDTHKKKMLEAFQDTKDIITKYNSNIKLND